MNLIAGPVKHVVEVWPDRAENERQLGQLDRFVPLHSPNRRTIEEQLESADALKRRFSAASENLEVLSLLLEDWSGQPSITS